MTTVCPISGLRNILVATDGSAVSEKALYEAIQLAKKDVPANDPHFRNLKDAVKRIALGGITAGHFVRGLLES